MLKGERSNQCFVERSSLAVHRVPGEELYWLRFVSMVHRKERVVSFSYHLLRISVGKLSKGLEVAGILSLSEDI